MTALLTTAYIYGVQAVSWVVANANWLIPMGSATITLIHEMFG